MIGDSDDRSGYAATYFPGTPNIAESQRITVGLGQTMSDMNLALMPTRTSRVSGSAVDSQGRPMAGMVMAMPRGDAMFMGFGPPAQIKPDGSFVVSGLTPGRYTLQVRGGFGDGESASADVTLSGDDVTGVRLTASKPSIVTGRVLVDPAAAQGLRPSTLRLGLQPVQMDMVMLGGMPPAPVTDDLTFELKAQPGKFRLSLFGQAPGWSIRVVRYRDADVTDSGIDFRANEDVAGIEVEMTNKVTEVSGQVTNAKGQAVTDYWIVVFPQDRNKWMPNSRYVRSGRPDQDGRFKVNGLPPGEYHIVALDFLDTSGDWNDAESLDRLRARAASFSINEGETKSIDLKIVSAS